MNIDYKNYVVYPYTMGYLRKVYAKDVLNKWADQLAFLFQNGFSLEDSDIDEQMMLFNGFKTYEDFEDLVKSFGKAGQFDEPTEIGYKIVDSLLEYVLKSSTFASKEFYDIKSAGAQLREKMNELVGYINSLLTSDDVEVKRVIKVLDVQKAADLVDECLDLYEEGTYNVLLIKYQALYQQISEMHKKCYRALLSSGSKGLQARMGNVNDEIYGSSGGFNPTDDAIKCVNGSAVFELKILADKSVSDSSIYYKMLVIAKEALENGEPSRLLKSFVKGDKSQLGEVRKALIEVDLSGIMVLLGLKHGLTLLENDSLNKERAKRIAHEFSAICKYVGLDGFELKA